MLVEGNVRVCFARFFGLTPYVATYSVAMWKDPIFSAALVGLTPLLFDFVLSRGGIVQENKFWLPCFLLLLVVIVFMRNNGPYIAIAVLIVLLGMALYFHKRSCQEWVGFRRALTVVFGVLIFYYAMTGPFYALAGVSPSPKVESFSVLLNQMARVAAYDGDMSESDKAYMESILPLDLYEISYRPGCIDLLKWDENFNASPLENDFFSHWVSMLVRNPKLYFEAWEIQTCGFWAVNVPEVNNYASNISDGVPKNIIDQDRLDAYGVHSRNVLRSDTFYVCFLKMSNVFQ